MPTDTDSGPAPETVRVLLVEDEMLIGMDLAVMLEDSGFEVDGPHASADAALTAIERTEPDIAVLDINLGGDQTSAPVADMMVRKSLPFIFLTGYSSHGNAGIEQIDDAPLITKPVRLEILLKELRDLLST